MVSRAFEGFTSILCGVCVCVGLSCTERATNEDSGGEGSGATSTDSASSAATSDVDSESASDSQTADAGEVCESFPDSYGDALPVTVTNTSDAVVFVELYDDCNQNVIGPLRQDGQSLPGNSECRSCQGFIDEGCECLFPPGGGVPCFVSAGLKLAPGASYESHVGTTAYTLRELPPACVDGDCPATCSQASPLPEGDYELALRYANSVECPEGTCDCELSDEAWCFVEVDGELSGPIIDLVPIVVLPGEGVQVDLF